MKEVDVVAIADIIDIQIQWHLFTRVRWNICTKVLALMSVEWAHHAVQNAKVIFELLMLALYETQTANKMIGDIKGLGGCASFLGSLS